MRVRRLVLSSIAAASLLVSFGARGDESGRLRVCADPNNLPFSDQDGTGFDNKLAELVATELHAKLEYTWWAQRRGFVRNTLKAGTCDLIMGVPASYELVETTRPYFRSTYVIVSRADRNLDIRSLRDPQLSKLQIGVHLIGDDGTNTPPAHALAELGMISNVRGYPIYGDYRERAPPARLIEAVVARDIDVAIAWGPLAGYEAMHAPVPLRVTPVSESDSSAALPFQFDIAMGVRRKDGALKGKLDDIIERKRPEIDALLARYNFPTVPIDAQSERGRYAGR